ncbi:hypothetical protein PCE1_001208 [Barthelona sp. PCE]
MMLKYTILITFVFLGLTLGAIGTYRTGYYFGLLNPDNSFKMTLGWFPLDAKGAKLHSSFRSTAENNDKIVFHYKEHIIEQHAVQEIVDKELGLRFTIIFIGKPNTDDFMVQVKSESTKNHDYGIILHINDENVRLSTAKTGQPSSFTVESSTYSSLNMKAKYKGVENFIPALYKKRKPNLGRVQFACYDSDNDYDLHGSLKKLTMENAKKRIRPIYRQKIRNGEFWDEVDNYPMNLLSNTCGKDKSQVFLQFLIDGDAEITVSTSEMASIDIDELKSSNSIAYKHKVDTIVKNWPIKLQPFVSQTIADVLGSVGYASGDYIVQKQGVDHRVQNARLFYSCPSRSFFPRGFVWDEAFHLLIICRVDMKSCEAILRSWFAIMDNDGWIPREVILGDEARSRVPEKFIPQIHEYSNPPAFSLVFDFLSSINSIKTQSIINDLLPLFKKHLQFFEDTHKVRGGYQWQGRNDDHTLTSGLDDYPRGNISVSERHVDLLSWMKYSWDVVGRLSGLPTPSFSQSVFQEHWNADIGLYSDSEAAHVGYVGLFPFLFEHIQCSDTPTLRTVYTHLNSTRSLFGPGGIRSLSKEDMLYGTGENYWRGATWMNINYLVKRSLDRYAECNDAVSADFHALSKRLKGTIVRNVLKEYKRTGWLWENYDGTTGRARGCRPFNGWTALFMLM